MRLIPSAHLGFVVQKSAIAEIRTRSGALSYLA